MSELPLSDGRAGTSNVEQVVNDTSQIGCTMTPISEQVKGETSEESSNQTEESRAFARLLQDFKRYAMIEESISRDRIEANARLPVDEDDETTPKSPNQTNIPMASSSQGTKENDLNALNTEHPMSLPLTPGQSFHNPEVAHRQGKKFSDELEKSLQSDEWLQDLSVYKDLENQVKKDSTTQLQKNGHLKRSYTYLLLDPRITDNLPEKYAEQKPLDSWASFVNSIFYVGRGQGARPYTHLKTALRVWENNVKTSNDNKIQHILDIWSNNVGVICLYVFQNVKTAEASINEASMIDVIGRGNLENIKSGSYYGVTTSWSVTERRMLGLYLLYKSMQIFFNEGERQLRPEDV